MARSQTVPREAEYAVHIPLKPEFRFVHEPITSATQDRFVGRVCDVEALVNRILRSDGGSFLVTGYRGVGKTSFLNQVIEQLKLKFRANSDGPSEVLDVQLNLSRAIPPLDLMFHIIRCLHSRLRELNLYPYLRRGCSPRTRIGIHANVNEYRWQGMCLQEKHSLGLPEFAFGAGPARFAFKTSGSIKQSTSHERQLTFVPYDERAAEYDLIRLARLLARGLQKKLAVVAILCAVLNGFL